MAFPLDDFALLAHGLDRRTNFHFVPLLDDKIVVDAASVFTAPRDPAACEVIRGKLNSDLVTGVDSDEMHTHLS